MFRTGFPAFFSLCGIGFIAAAAFAHPELQTRPNPDEDNNIRNYLQRAAAKVTHESLAGVHTLGDWLAQREDRYRDYLGMMSLTDVPVEGERPPLNVTITGEIQQDGFRVVKLYYESLPGLYTPAHLYIPDNLEKPAPAVLYVCGHSRTQMHHYQAHPRRFAELGFVTLIIETIQYGEVRGSHHGCYAEGQWQWYSRGYNPGGTELWNGIRGIDLLCSLGEVDADNIGVTGISGGGTQSWYIGAADPRVKAVAPVCGTSTLESHIYQRTVDGHCDCMMPVNTKLIDFHDIGALIAPRPLFIASAERDGLNAIEAARLSYEYIKRIYDLHGAGDRIHFMATPGGHSYHESSRKAIFSFMMKHLMGKDVPPAEIEDIDTSGETWLGEEDLRVFVNGPPEDNRTTTIQESLVKLAEPPEIEDMGGYNELRAKTLDFLWSNTFYAFPRDPADLDVRFEFRAMGGGSNGWQTYSYVSEEGFRLRFNLYWRDDPAEPKPVLLVLRNANEERRETENRWSNVPDGWNRAYLDVRGVGDSSWSPALQWHVRRAAAWTGRTVASMRVYDVMRCLEALRSLDNVNVKRIALAGEGEMAAVALYAALLDGNVESVLLQNPPATQNAPSQPDGRGDAIEMLNCLRITDLPQAAGLLLPAETVFVGEPPETYRWAFDTLDRLGHGDSIRQVRNLGEWRPE